MRDAIDALDPSSSHQLPDIQATLRVRRGRYEPELLDFARRVHQETPDEETRLDALNLLASAAVVGGNDPEGARLFREALDAAWGSDLHAERVACINLAMILARQRRLIEAFAVGRRACALAIATGEKLGICLAHAQLAKVLDQLGDSEGFAAAVDTAEASLPEMDDTISGWVPHLIKGLRAELLTQQGELEAAEALLDEALTDVDVISEVVLMGRATSSRRLGRPDEALAFVQTALAQETLDSSFRIRFLAEELLCLIDLDEIDRVRELASACLDEMTRAGRACGIAHWRMQVGVTVGAALARSGGCQEEARQAYEMAAVAALERSWESKTFFQEFPQIEQLDPEDLEIIEAHGERFRAEHLELAGALRGLLQDGDRPAARLLSEGDDEVFIAVCAWCSRVRGPERTWVPLDDYEVGNDQLNVSHGICRACRSGVMKQPLEGRSPAAAQPSDGLRSVRQG